MKTVNEKTTSYLTVEMLDKNGAPALPDSVSYQIDCLSTKQLVRLLTPLTPAAQIEITLTPNDTAILLQGNRSERKRVTVVANYGVDDAINDQYDFVVKNLSGIS